MFFPANRVASIVLSGGEGRRLFPLTQHRPKPALPFGEFRVIDVSLSHSLNAGIRKIFVLTQFLSAALHRHLIDTYQLDHFSPGFIEILSPEQRPGHWGWYLGTADAVRQNVEYLRHADTDYFLILSGDQIYTLDFNELMRYAIESDADVTVAALPIGSQEATRMGILEVNERSEVVDFFEKPQSMELHKKLIAKESLLAKRGFKKGKEHLYLASMGIYVFKRKALFDLLDEDPREDFGKHLIPTKVKQGSVVAYLHNGYWEDIGTVASLHQANMILTQKDSPFLHMRLGERVFYRSKHLPAAKIVSGEIKESVLCSGACVEAKRVIKSVIGPRAQIREGSIIEESVLFGSEEEQEVSIGPKATIRRAILDKNVTIGANVQLINREQVLHVDAPPIYVRDGIILVTQDTHLPDGFVF